nr:TOBE domain-containing protein [Pseudomonadales bacterium]
EYNWASGVVRDIAYFGDMSVYHVQLPSGKKVLCTMANTRRRHEEEPPTWGDEVFVSWDGADSVLLTA